MEDDNSTNTRKGLPRADEPGPSIVLNGVPICWNLEQGDLTFFGIKSALFWLNPSLLRMLEPLVEEIGPEMFRLLVAHSSSIGTDEDYQAMVTVLGSTFEEGFLAWGRCVTAAGWGQISLPNFDRAACRATVAVKNPWELLMQAESAANLGPNSRSGWGCPFMMGKIIGLFSQAFGKTCWADESVERRGDDSYLTLSVYPSTKTISDEIASARRIRENTRERYLNEQIDAKTQLLLEAEKRLREYSSDLEAQVALRTKELDEARAVAEEANRAKSRFLAHMSHEIRTPMNGILGGLEVLADSGLNSDQVEWAESTLESARGLLSILNDILDFSKIEAGKLQFDPQPFALGATIRRTVQLLVPKAEADGLQLFCDLDSVTPEYVISDETKLRQVMINLVTNSIKFTRPGGAIGVFVRSRVDGDHVVTRFYVIDSGIGISAMQQRRIFEAFSQADASISRQFGGTGLGLAISQQIVAGLGGTLEVRSRVDIGTCFTFELRFERGVVLPQQVVQPQANLELLRGLRVLVAEDNRVNQAVLSRMLEKLGCFVTLAQNGEEAVTSCRAETYDVILMDIQMPVLNGLEATRIIRAGLDASASIPIIAVTANAFAEDRDACLQMGATDYLTKPIRSEVLVSKLVKVAMK